MKISARNQFKGKIVSIENGAVNSMVTIDANCATLSGTISKAAVEELGLTVGGEAIAIIKATEVMVGLGEFKISARNKFAGKVASITEGAVNSIVAIEVCCGNLVTATISNNAVKDLGLAVGTEAVAVIKATSVMFGVE